MNQTQIEQQTEQQTNQQTNQQTEPDKKNQQDKAELLSLIESTRTSVELLVQRQQVFIKMIGRMSEVCNQMIVLTDKKEHLKKFLKENSEDNFLIKKIKEDILRNQEEKPSSFWINLQKELLDSLSFEDFEILENK